MEWSESELSAKQLAGIAEVCARLQRDSASACVAGTDVDAQVIAIAGGREVVRPTRLEELARFARSKIEGGEDPITRWGDRLAEDGKYFSFL